MGLSFSKQLQILILSTRTGPCQAQSFLKKHLEESADSKEKHPPADTTALLPNGAVPRLQGLQHGVEGSGLCGMLDSAASPALLYWAGNKAERQQSAQPKAELRSPTHAPNTSEAVAKGLSAPAVTGTAGTRLQEHAACSHKASGDAFIVRS